MIFDAGALYSFFVRGDPDHWGTVGRVDLLGRLEELVVSPFVIAELEVRMLRRFGREGWAQVFEQLASGAWTIAVPDSEHLEAMSEGVGRGKTLAGASVAVLVAGDSS